MIGELAALAKGQSGSGGQQGEWAQEWKHETRDLVPLQCLLICLW